MALPITNKEIKIITMPPCGAKGSNSRVAIQKTKPDRFKGSNRKGNNSTDTIETDDGEINLEIASQASTSGYKRCEVTKSTHVSKNRTPKTTIHIVNDNTPKKPDKQK